MKITFRMWIWIICVALALLSIFSFSALTSKGVLVKSVEHNTSIFENGLRRGMIIQEINSQKVQTTQDFIEIMSNIFADNQSHKIEIKTKTLEIIDISESEIKNQIIVSEIPKTKLITGLDIQGGARALVSSEHPITESQLDDLIAISEQRFNLYGLTDIKIGKVSDLSGNKFMLIEIAGSSPSDLEELITKQGKFEAKIGNETVFIGGERDITYVGRSGGDAIITGCDPSSGGGYVCKFMFVITLSPEAADHYAAVTAEIPINASNPEFLEKTIDFYLDDKLTESLLISKGLKGNAGPQHSIQGNGIGATQEEAIKNAKLEMKKLQTILVTGSIPFKLKIVKTDRISPRLGSKFTNQILLAGLLAFIGVALVIFVRYRKIKLSFTMLTILLSETLMTLGIAALIKWNLDLPSIAGIITAIGTGVDDQAVIIDESETQEESLKQRIKNAFRIVFSSYATTAAALIPLTGALAFLGIGAVSAGLLKGFAITTLIGITSGVFITRPAFADIIRQLKKD